MIPVRISLPDYKGHGIPVNWACDARGRRITRKETAPDGDDNITRKSDVGDYTYGSARPHAMTQAGNLNYTYDANGSMCAPRPARGRVPPPVLSPTPPPTR